MPKTLSASCRSSAREVWRERSAFMAEATADNAETRDEGTRRDTHPRPYPRYVLPAQPAPHGPGVYPAAQQDAQRPGKAEARMRWQHTTATPLRLRRPSRCLPSTSRQH